MTALVEREMLKVVSTTKKYTLDEYMCLPDDGKRYELKKGELVEMPGPGIAHGQIIITIASYINAFCLKSNLGRVVSDTAFVLDPINEPNSARRPDVALVMQARFEAVEDYDNAFFGAPDLAVEVVSRSDFFYDVSDKIQEYLQAGVQLVWVINPHSNEVYVYSPGQHALLLDGSDELDGGAVLAGFKLKVNDIFK